MLKIIRHVEVPAGGQTSVVLDNIPDTYDDLYIIISVSGAANELRMRFNGSTANYTDTLAYGIIGPSLTAVVSAGTNGYGTDEIYVGAKINPTSGSFSTQRIYISNYASANPKLTSGEHVKASGSNVAFGSGVTIIGGNWNDSSAISSITFSGDNDSIYENSSFTLYGITAGSDGVTTVS